MTVTAEKFCPTCEDYRTFTACDRNETYNVRGTDITVPVKVEICDTCHEARFDDTRDNEMFQRVYAEYRNREGLLTPEQIKDVRARWRLSQKSFALLIGMSEATVNRYEQGGLQDRVHDEAIRACRYPQFVRDVLRRRGRLLSVKQRLLVQAALTSKSGRPRFRTATPSNRAAVSAQKNRR